MTDRFRADDAAFFAFERHGGGRGRFWAAGLAYIIGQAGVLALGLFIARGFLDTAVTEISAGRADNAQLAFMPLREIVGFTSLLIWPLFVAVEAAMLRWMLGREDIGWALGLRFGADEFRVMAVHAVLLIGLGLALLLFTLAVSLPVGVLAAFASETAAVISAFVLAPVALGGFLYLAVKFSPAAALTIARRRFQVFEAWTTTNGRFWSLLGANVLVVFLSLIFALVAVVVAGIAGAPMLAPVARTLLSGPNSEEIAAIAAHVFGSPLILAWAAGAFVIFMFVDFVGYVLRFGVSAKLVAFAEQRDQQGAAL